MEEHPAKFHPDGALGFLKMVAPTSMFNFALPSQLIEKRSNKFLSGKY